MTEEGYNGWKNYPTWCVNLWLSNDEGLYNETLELTRQSWSGLAPRASAADAIRDFVRDDLTSEELTETASLSADLLGYALDSVDWFEIADAWIEIVSDAGAFPGSVGRE